MDPDSFAAQGDIYCQSRFLATRNLSGFFQLSPNTGSSPVNGTISLAVAVGKDFEFIVGANYSLNGAATFTFDNFSFTAVPEPEPSTLTAGLGLLAFALWRRRRRIRA